MAIERDETNLKTFNAAKKFAEEILFPLMEQYQAYQRQSDFGATTLNEAIVLTEDVREIERYNGLKAMRDVCINLAFAIKSTVQLKGNKEEIEMLNNLIDCLDKIKNLFYEYKDRFFTIANRNERLIDILNIAYFDGIKRTIQICYINIEILMTRNKLLFADASDEFASDEQIQEDIIKEYSEG